MTHMTDKDTTPFRGPGTKGTAYVAGPMTGIKAANFPAFIAADQWLHSHGWATFNPAVHELNNGIVPEEILDMSENFFPELEALGFTFCKRHALRRDMNAIADADAIILIDGWEKSSGANLELAAAIWANVDTYRLRLIDGEYDLGPWVGPS